MMVDHLKSHSHNTGGKIIKLSTSTSLNMAESWHDIASLEHFWIVRRFQVLQKVFALFLQPSIVSCDIGCGRGLLQLQLYRNCGLCADGIDLNEQALENHLGLGTLYLYNILERAHELKEKYQMLFLFDVLEHISETDDFLDACSYLLKPGGHVIINVPASSTLYSAYDKAAGHLRRYSIESLRTETSKIGLKDVLYTYWGFTYVPLILLRKFLYRNGSIEDIIKKGFEVKNRYMNEILLKIGQFEYIPQQFFGSSIMMAVRKI
jgi:SAM-dependent methyltransferase